MDDDSVDLLLTSPPYENCRSYGSLGFNLTGQDWVDWCIERWVECNRVCKGLVAWVVEGRTRKFQWSATPALLMADLHRAGIRLRKPPIYHRIGIPGSGGPDWLRNDFELVVCSSKGRLPWSDPTACGHPPKFPPGGAMSNRSGDGRRCSERPQREGNVRRPRTYVPPEKSNPGNAVHCHGGGGHMGHPLAHENDAPFALGLAEFFVKSFCPPGGTVLDIFCGSSTTGHAAIKNERNYIGIDIRPDQIDLSKRRLHDIGCKEIAAVDARGLKQKEFSFSG